MCQHASQQNLLLWERKDLKSLWSYHSSNSFLLVVNICEVNSRTITSLHSSHYKLIFLVIGESNTLPGWRELYNSKHWAHIDFFFFFPRWHLRCYAGVLVASPPHPLTKWSLSFFDAQLFKERKQRKPHRYITLKQEESDFQFNTSSKSHHDVVQDSTCPAPLARGQQYRPV